MLARLNSLWVGNSLGYMEQLCLLSAVANGHPFTLYSYTPDDIQGVPNGVDVRDAREVVPEETFAQYTRSAALALRSDFFRYALVARDLGFWVDMDLYVLKPLDFKDDYVFGWESQSSINGAVLRMPANSRMVQDLCNFPRLNKRPPWFGPKRTLLYYYARLRRGNVQADELPWGTFGPALITYLAKQHGVAGRAQQSSVFYPVPFSAASALFGPAEAVEAMIRPNTRTVHMWHGRLVGLGLANSTPPHKSFLDVVCRRYNIDTGRSLFG